ncbi:MAG: SUMF1/EgtB/PvdO family nonheme iron enzyme [Rhodospirillaceae bacterium]|nr:SUMF1/EgtB/PvdO family nonheme iron enzyme [Rhodospirillaceae bacterium]
MIPVALLLASVTLAHAAPLNPGDTLRDCSRCPEMIVVPAGAFRMGTPVGTDINNETGEMPPVEMTIPRPFLIGRYELTRGEFEVFARETGFEPKILCRVWNRGLNRYDDDANRTWRNPGVPANPRPEHPVSCVSWPEAKLYIDWLSARAGKAYRLPTEAEWEYAARAGSSALYPWGESPHAGCKYANVYDITTLRRTPQAWPHAGCVDGFSDIAPAGSLEPNAFGIYDMIGNVWEWAEDCATKSHIGRPKDGSAWRWQGGCKRVIQRGGGWFTSVERARPGYHGDATATDHFDFGGFRVARDLTAEELR